MNKIIGVAEQDEEPTTILQILNDDNMTSVMYIPPSLSDPFTLGILLADVIRQAAKIYVAQELTFNGKEVTYEEAVERVREGVTRELDSPTSNAGPVGVN